jgi:hypothetical protein
MVSDTYVRSTYDLKNRVHWWGWTVTDGCWWTDVNGWKGPDGWMLTDINGRKGPDERMLMDVNGRKGSNEWMLMDVTRWKGPDRWIDRRQTELWRTATNDNVDETTTDGNGRQLRRTGIATCDNNNGRWWRMTTIVMDDDGAAKWSTSTCFATMVAKN